MTSIGLIGKYVWHRILSGKTMVANPRERFQRIFSVYT